MKKYALGSINSAKAKATKEVLERFEERFEFETVSVDSGISDMPTSYEEARTGAFNRAKRAENKIDTDYGIGIEAFVEHGKYLTVWSVITKKGEIIGEGGSGRVKLPEKISRKIPERELGDVIGEIMGDEKIREKEGVVGVLTDGKITRKEFTKTSLTFAFSESNGYKLR